MTSINRRRFLATVAAVPIIAYATADAAAATDAISALVAAINSTDSTVRAAWLTDWVSPAALKRTLPKEWLDTIQSLFELSGGIDLVGTEVKGREVSVMIRTHKQRLERVFKVLTSKDDPSKLSNLFVAPFPASFPNTLLNNQATPAVLRSKIAERISFSAKRDEFSGVVRVVAPDGSVLLQESHGMADHDKSEANTAAHRFNLGSIGKMFTAAVIAQLITAGRITLDTRLADVLPEYPSAQNASKITIRHLLSHTAGLGDLWSRPGWSKDLKFERMLDLLPLLSDPKLYFEPGSKASYSNEGFVVLGAVAEKLAGRSWFELETSLMRAAGMTASGPFRREGKAPLRARGYQYAEDDILGLQGRKPNDAFLATRSISCGGEYATAVDMTTYLSKLRLGKIIPGSVLGEFVQQQPGGLAEYGLGHMVQTQNGRTIVGHNGGGLFSGINADAKIVWETGWTYAVLGNYDAPFAQAIGDDISEMLSAQN